MVVDNKSGNEEPALPISSTAVPKGMAEPAAPVSTTAVGASAGNGTKESSGAAETPWGVSWAELLPTLTAPADYALKVDSVIEEVGLALARASLSPRRLLAGGAYGRGTHSAGFDETVALYAVYDDFDAGAYVDKHFEPLMAAMAATKEGEVKPQFGGVEGRGLAVSFCAQGVDFLLYAAGVLYGGPNELLTMNAPQTGGDAKALVPRDVHVQTTCEVLRTELLSVQSPMYKDLVRVARKWRNGLEYSSDKERPSNLLLELVMLEAFQAAGGVGGKVSGEAYADIFRRFLSTLAAQSARGAHVVGGVDQPRTFIAFTTLYSMASVDWAVARGLLGGGDADLCVVDPAAPHVDVARDVESWGTLRAAARKTMAAMQAHDLVEALSARLHHFSVGVDATLRSMRDRMDALAAVEASPRRWSGTVAFTELHLGSDTWCKVAEIELRCLKWHINVRRSRSDSTGYSRTADVSLQIVALKRKLQRTIDVDVHFQGHTAQLVFGPDVDHVLIAKRSEILRNREYSMQITVIA